MNDLVSCLMIAGAVLALIFVLWCVDKYFAEENADRARRRRAVRRKKIIEDNAKWYADTRTGDARADLVRVWEELDV